MPKHGKSSHLRRNIYTFRVSWQHGGKQGISGVCSAERGKPCVTVPVLPCENSCGAWRPLAEKVTGRKPNKDGITACALFAE